MEKNYTRRDFIGLTAATMAGAFLVGCAGGGGKEVYIPPLLDQAPDGPELTAGLVGCGGRGTGAALNFLDAGPNLRVTALADVLEDRIAGTRKRLKEEKNVEIPDENIFLGFDGYQPLIDSGVDVVILATPPYFRPEHFAAAVEAKKHLFMEKPVAVDPVGARSIMATSRKAETLGLQVSTGTQRRHKRDYIETYRQVANGAIGEIVGGNVYWNMGQLWYREPRSEWSEMEYMIRDWVNWTWLSGDHIVEQHVHNLDVFHWFTGAQPVSCVGFGSRHRRVTGNQYDNFSIDFQFENGVHLHSMCRQINGCANKVAETIRGTKGYAEMDNGGLQKIFDTNGNLKWEYNYPEDQDSDSRWQVTNPYVQEHVDMVTNIRNNTPIVEAEATAISTLMAIMGRISAYTGKEVTWDAMMNSNLELGPEELIMGPVRGVNRSVPVPGTE